MLHCELGEIYSWNTTKQNLNFEMKWLCPTKHGSFDILVQKEKEGLGMIFATKGDLFHACGAAPPS